MAMRPEDDEAANAWLRRRSGEVQSTDPIVSLLYTLLRDGDVAPGRIEEIVRPIVHAATMDNRTTLYSNGYLAQYCQDVVKRLRDVDDLTWRQAAAAVQCTHVQTLFWVGGGIDEGGLTGDAFRIDWCKDCGAVRIAGQRHDGVWNLPGRKP